MNYLDLFSGIGGFSLAAQRAGIEIDKHYYSEVDKYAQWIYRRQFPKSIRLGDIRKIGNEHGKIDIFTGGFPCQSFSIAGKRGGFEDTRGTLFFEIERLARFYKPSYMVLENVKGLFSHDGGNTIRVILDKLRGLDYAVQLLLLNTVDFRIPQNRERLFFICTDGGKCQPEISNIRERKSSAPFSSNAIDANYWKGIDNHGQRTCIEITKNQSQGYRVYDPKGASCTLAGEAGGVGAKTGLYAIPVLSPDRLEKRQNGRRFKKNGDPMFTLTAQDKHGVLLSDSGQGRKREVRTIAPPLKAHDGCGHDNYIFNDLSRNENINNNGISPTLRAESHGNLPSIIQDTIIRRLTPTECERLQDYPDGWTQYGINESGEQIEISDSQRYKTLGNSITVKPAEEIFRAIKGAL